MHSCPRPRLRPLQLPHRPQHPPPHRAAVQAASLKHGVRPHGGMDRRVLAVALYDYLGGAVDVEVGDHRQKLEPGCSIRLSTEFTPAELDCLRLAIVGTGVSALSHLNAMSFGPN